jgi:hypothetical protein
VREALRKRYGDRVELTDPEAEQGPEASEDVPF